MSPSVRTTNQGPSTCFPGTENAEHTGFCKDKALGQWLLSQIRTTVTKVAVYKIGECFDAYCQGTGLLLLLDGLDEVSKPQYPRVSRAIQALSDDLARESKDNAIVLTMRTQFYQQFATTLVTPWVRHSSCDLSLLLTY